MNAPPPKWTLERLRAGMRVFLYLPDAERALQADIDSAVARILLSKAQNGGRHRVDVLSDYLNAGKDADERLKIIIGLSKGSLETLKRIYEAMFPDVKWSRLRHDDGIRRRVAEFLMSPHAEEMFIPTFIRESFDLPNNWIELLQDRDYLRAVVRESKKSQYSVSMGNALEDEVRNAVRAAGYNCAKGRVGFVDDKEVDIAIPDLEDPQILIMSSYQLTTASSQTSKANEQSRMYEYVRRHNGSRARRGKPDAVFVNVVDGGGWLARPNDLQTMWNSCDHCFPLSGLNGLREVLQYHLGT